MVEHGNSLGDVYSLQIIDWGLNIDTNWSNMGVYWGYNYRYHGMLMGRVYTYIFILYHTILYLYYIKSQNMKLYYIKSYYITLYYIIL